MKKAYNTKQPNFCYSVLRETMHLKSILVILILLLFSSCQENKIKIQYYPDDTLYIEKDAEIIRLDTTKLNFKQITDKIGTYYNNFGKLVVEFDDGKLKKRIIPFVYDGGLIKERNILEITSDSILIDDGYAISELKRILKRHYTNKGKIPYYSESPYNALVEVTVDTSKTGKELKQALTNLTRTFDEIKDELQDSIKLSIYFDYLRQTPLPPAPPKE